MRSNEEYFIEQRFWSRGGEDAEYSCPDIDCHGVVTLNDGYWQCDECSFRSKHITKNN